MLQRGYVTTLLVYALSLVVAVLVSSLAQRTVLSTAVLFLAAGFLVGDGVLGLVVLRPDDSVVGVLVEIALFTVLFTDACRRGCATSPRPGACLVARCCLACR